MQEQNQSSGIFESIPLSHFSPAFNVVTFAGEVNYLDVTATESEKSQYVDNSLTSRITGYQIEPYVALSLKSFGLGLTGEAGNYVTSYTGYESTPGSSYRINYNDKGIIDYSGIGFTIFFNPFPKLRRDFKLSINLSNKLLNVKHRAIDSGSSSSSTVNVNKSYFETKYTVTRQQAGINAQIHITRKFSVIPWADYSLTNTSQIDDKIQRVVDGGGGELNFIQRYYSDVEMVWKVRNEATFGIDFALKIYKLEVHFGSIVGFFTNSSSSTAGNIDGPQVSVSIAYETDG